MKPSLERVKQIFSYEPDTGNLIFLKREASEFHPARYAQHLKKVGTVARSTNSEGYIKVHVDGRYYSAHRIIWLMMTGEWPEYPDFEIDHINGNPTDNRWENLRKVTKSENQRNACRRVNNSSGVHGVNWKPKYNKNENDGRWVARIWNGPRHVYLGGFKTLHEAAIARKAAERVLGFTRTNENPSEQAVQRKASRKERSRP